MSAPFLDAPGRHRPGWPGWRSYFHQSWQLLSKFQLKMKMMDKKGVARRSAKPEAPLQPLSAARPEAKPKRPRRETRAGQPGEGVKAKAPSFKPLSKTEANSKGQKYRSSQISPRHHAMKKGAKQCSMPVVCALSPDPFFRRTKSTAAVKQANEAGRNKRHSQ